MPDRGSSRDRDDGHTVERTFVGLPSPAVGRAGAGGHPCQGIYHAPSGARPTTAFIATHYNVDFSEHYLASFLAGRGYGFLGWNTRFRGAEAYFLLDHTLAEIAVGVSWLRQQGIERVVLLGNSGGGSLMGAYHSQSVEPNIRPARDRTILPAALELPPCDLFVFVAAHPGRPEILTDWMDASVIDENDPLVAGSVTRPVRPRPALRRRVRDPLPRRPGRPQRSHHRVVPRRARPPRRRRAPRRRPAVHDHAHVGRPADDGRRARPLRPPDAVVLQRRPAPGQRRRVRHRHASARAAAGSTCGASPTPTAGPDPTSPASTCRR